jgi:hypothetical protein
MRIAVSPDMDEPIAGPVIDELFRRRHTVDARAPLCAGARAVDSARKKYANAPAPVPRAARAPVPGGILDAWFAATPSGGAGDRDNVARVSALEGTS